MRTPAWSHLDFAKLQPHVQVAGGSAEDATIASALVAQDPAALVLALNQTDPAWLKEDRLSHKLNRNFSPQCAQVLFSRGLLDIKLAFKLAVEQHNVAHARWWLCDDNRLYQLQKSAKSTYYTPDEDWIFQSLVEWSKSHPSSFVEVAKALPWAFLMGPSPPETPGKSTFRPIGFWKASRFPWGTLFAPLLLEVQMPLSDVRDIVESAMDNALLLPFTGSIPAPDDMDTLDFRRAAVMDTLLGVFRQVNVESSQKMQALVESSPMLSKAWDDFWTHPIFKGKRVDYLTFGVSSANASSEDTFKQSAFAHPTLSFVEDLLSVAAPSIVDILKVPPHTLPDGLHENIVRVLKTKPHILGGLLRNMGVMDADDALKYLLDDLSDVSYRGHCLTRVLVERYFTSLVKRSLIHNPITLTQLSLPGPDGKTPIQWLQEKAHKLNSTDRAAELEFLQSAQAMSMRHRLGALAHVQPTCGGRKPAI